MGSEAHFLYLQNQGVNIAALLICASFGNTLGGMSCYLIARWGGRTLVKKYLKHDDEKLELWVKKLDGRGEFMALLCWLPIIGELIAAALGFVSNKVVYVLVFMLVGKFLRYVVVAGLWASLR